MTSTSRSVTTRRPVTWFTKAEAVGPDGPEPLLALGAATFNNNDNMGAEKYWKQALALDPNNVEAHYDLGFLYLNSVPPDMAGVQREWGEVVRLAPGTDVANSVQTHLAALASDCPPPALRCPARCAGSRPAPARRRRTDGWLPPPPAPARADGGPRHAGGEPASVNAGGRRGGILIAFAGGVLSFASPCCLPLVPAYLGYMVGATRRRGRPWPGLPARPRLRDRVLRGVHRVLGIDRRRSATSSPTTRSTCDSSAGPC